MADADESGLLIDDLRIELNGRPLIRLDARIRPGETMTLMGPSGSGKSTLLNAIVGLVDPAFDVSGRIKVDGRDVTDLTTERRRIGVLFQDDLLFPHMSVAGNLAFGLQPGLRGRARRQARIEEALRDIDLPSIADRDPATLSGGQKTRVALMRVLLSEPKALLLDEPFARLDAHLRDQIRKLTFARIKERRLPALLVTHDAADAEAAGGEIVAVS